MTRLPPPEWDGETDDVQLQHDVVTVGVVDDGEAGPPTQIVITLAEAKVMQYMPGGLCLVNWLRLRGLLDEPMKES